MGGGAREGRKVGGGGWGAASGPRLERRGRTSRPARTLDANLLQVGTQAWTFMAACEAVEPPAQRLPHLEVCLDEGPKDVQLLLQLTLHVGL